MHFDCMANDLRQQSMFISIAVFLTLKVIQFTFRLIKVGVRSKMPSKTIILKLVFVVCAFFLRPTVKN